MRSLALFFFMLCGCAGIGPGALQRTRVSYNETVKATSEQEMLLNIVRLRYGDTPSSLAISNIAAQYEFAGGVGGTPFWQTAGTGAAAMFLPNVSLGGADRPTLSLTPLDDGEFARRLFTPLSLEGVIYLAKTTWPIQTVFRLYLENLNWVPNAQTASGPTPALAPASSDFNEGMKALQLLQQRGDLVFGAETTTEPIGPKVTTIATADLLSATQQGLDVVGADGRWQLQREKRHYHVRINAASLDSAEMQTLQRVFRLKPKTDHFEVTVEETEPFANGATDRIDLETRSLLQALYFVSHGVNVPPEHLSRGLARETKTADGKPYDWSPLLAGLFNVKSTTSDCSANAHVAVEYAGTCFFIDATDHDTRATFALLMELSRLQLSENTRSKAPLLTIPIGR
ncbi:MAG: hypothetical protein JNM17_27265 [Archangium sp.]|nr:hypothetical protein [Archangium sp.]